MSSVLLYQAVEVLDHFTLVPIWNCLALSYLILSILLSCVLVYRDPALEAATTERGREMDGKRVLGH